MWFFANRLAKRYHRDHGHGGSHDHPRHPTTGTKTHQSGTREIEVVKRVLDANDAMAARMRAMFREKAVFVLNMMSSPGSGKPPPCSRPWHASCPNSRVR